MYCPVCYFQLTVPEKSTLTPVDPSRLYEADAEPVDVREMTERRNLRSLACPVCRTNLTVSREQVGTEILCPECETQVAVPPSFAAEFEEPVSPRPGPQISGATYGLAGEAPDSTGFGSLIPVLCGLCGTRLYARPGQVGTEMTCPDCGTKTRVPEPPKRVVLPPPPPGAFEGASTFGVAGEPESRLAPREALVPVVCSLCGTRMYARESEIGSVKVCPDCGRETEIKSVPEELKYTPENDADGYGISEAEPPPRPAFRTLTDYRYVEGSVDKELYGDKPAEESDAASAFPGRKPKTPPAKRGDREGGSSESVTLLPVRKIKRRELPRFPLVTRLLLPFTDRWLLLRWLAASVVGVLAFVVGTLMPGLWIVVSAPFGVFTLLCAGSLLANTATSLFLWSTTGNDLPESDDWLEYHLTESLPLTVWLFFVAILSAFPGYWLGHQLPLSEEITAFEMLRNFTLAVLSLGLFFPIFYLSSMESGSYFVLLAKETLRSIFRHSGPWFRFYGISLLLVAFTGFAFYVSEKIAFHFMEEWHAFYFFMALFFPAFALAGLVYFRLMGRLGWVLEERAREEDDY